MADTQGPLHYSPVTPYLVVSNAVAAIAFYEQAFGAEERSRMATPDGRKLLHAELALNGGTLMISDDFAEDPAEASTPEALGGSPVTFHLLTDQIDALWAAAVAAGAEVTMPLERQFWGATYGRLRDPFGHNWSLGTPDQPVSDEELREGAAKAMPGFSGD